jgi:hypothetical protein
MAFGPRCPRVVAEIRAVLAVGGDSIADVSPLDESLRWAEAFAERVDPLTRIRERVSAAVPERTEAS